VDTDGDRIMDYAYAGDLKGNMWKFDLKTLTSPYKLFAAGTSQPITSAPAWGPSPVASEGGVMVYFGTGKYLGATDLEVTTTTPIQGVYGIWDKGAAVGKTELQEQEILEEETSTSGRLLRKTSSSFAEGAWADGKRGWYMDLILGSTNEGERVVENPRLSLGWLMFTTAIPKEDRCDAGGDSWFFLLDPQTGNRPASVALDVDKDGKFDSEDLLSDGETAPSAAKSEIGILSSPLTVVHSSSSWDPLIDMVGGSGEAGDSSADSTDTGTGTTFTSGSSGKIKEDEVLCNGCSPPTPPTSPTPGVSRIFWRQIQ
jgi:type IV pilus assembly protein PilY1